ncbi:MAG TPA: carboxypeptidase-like regulatory domain-containing protein [Gemmataceae bacterium]|nr:carboxypeptidase-like regulatory domain-containing protein [Gemmataceae bacterium]
MYRKRFAIGILAITVVAAGCSKPQGSGRLAVSGTVRINGQPIKDGAIVLFEPLESQDTGGNATVYNGAFTIPQQSGLKPGRYLVRVTAGDGQTAVNPVDPNSPPGPTANTNIISKDLVPASWNEDSKQEVNVTRDGPNKFDFDIH